MTFQSPKLNRNKDPFSVQPLPKSFYHPSPTKEVNEREVIRSPQRRNYPTTKGAEVEEFLRQSPTFHTSALPNVRTLHDLEKTRPDLLKQRDVTDSSELDETWPDSERPNSVSTTSVPEDTEAESPDMNIGDVKLKYQSSLVDVMGRRISDKKPVEDTEESVLQRYVERFRNSTPKSREERMKEKSDKLHFWWLQPSSDRGNNSVDDSKGNNLQLDQSLPEARPQSQKLTKDALLAMDEETFHLQSKADRLLSRSELSLASSSPIVSTEGLGSSTSVSNSSVADSQLPYQPAYIRAQENYNQPTARLYVKTENKTRLHTASRSPADDILTRWRLQRKVEEANIAVGGGHREQLSRVKPSRNTELDVRLENFRRKILSQKALVTQQDILNERQRLSLLMDDVRQNGDIENKETPQAPSRVDVEEPVRDIILEKLQRITRSQDYRPAETEASSIKIDHRKNVSSFSVSTGDHDFSINNANFVHGEFSKNGHRFLADPTLNRNNTALSDRVLQDINMDDDGEPEVVVDSFESQVVFDSKKTQFLLESSGTESNKSTSGSLIDEGDRELSNEKKKVGAEGFHQKQTIFAGNLQNANSKIRNVKYNNDAGSNETDCSEASRQNSGDIVQAVSGNNMSNNNGKYVEKEQKPVNKRMNENFYQYLEAEKPISESKVDVREGKNTDTVIISDDIVAHTEEKQEKVEERHISLTSRKMSKSIKQTEEQEEVFEGREYAREQNKRKGRHKQIKKGRDKDNVDTSERDVLVDITNDRNELVTKGSYSELSSVKGCTDNVISYENKDGSDHLGRLGKKPRPVTASSVSPGRYSVNQRPLVLAQAPVQHAIGQAIADHLFDGSTLASSVDSWASAFPQSPGLSHSVNGSGYSAVSPTPSQRDSTLLESTPRLQVISDQQADSDDEYTSDGEFHEDPLLQILRSKRDHYRQQLINVEEKLQAMET